MARYSEAFKNAIIEKILSPESKSIRSVARESDLPIGTVLNWLKQKEINVPMEKLPQKSVSQANSNSLSEQFKIILETAAMSDETLSAYCRQKGIYPSDIEVWKQEMLDNLDARNKKTLAKENNDLKVQNRELKSELKCKEKALAESAALLLLKKKARIIWGGSRGRRLAKEDKLAVLELVKIATKQGARKWVACKVLGLSIRTLQRWQSADKLDDQRQGPKTTPGHCLTVQERSKIIEISNTKEFSYLPPSQIVPRLADQGEYIASESSFYRVLKAANQDKRRGKQKSPSHSKPKSHVATEPNQIWSWDISYLPTTVRGLYYYLYFYMDIYSRKIVGYGVYEAERANYAEEVVQQACLAEGIVRNQIALHADNGSPMKASTFLATLNRLGITPSFSRPGVSNDNPYSEALFKTTKYCYRYPKKPFETLDEARHWVDEFVHWYNHEHLHSGIKFITPNDRHFGKDQKLIQQRIVVYQNAKKRHPQRWSRAIRNWELPTEVYLNPSKQI